MRYPGSESNRLEFKKTIPQNGQILKSVCGFANQFGGELLIGVAADGEVVGVSEEESRRLLQFLDQLIVEGVFPPMVPQIYVRAFDEKLVVAIQVSPGSQKPYYVRNEGPDNGVYIRLGPTTHRASAEMIDLLRWQARGRTFDSMPCFQATGLQLQMASLKKFFANRPSTPTEPTEALLESYQILVREQGIVLPTYGGLLLFSETPQQYLPESFIICTHYKSRGEREVLATKDCVGPLPQQRNDALDWVLSRLNRSFVIRGLQRTETLEIPLEALREAITNAIIHRNYGIHSTIKISIEADRIEIWSPGGFPGPLDPKQLEQGVACSRNPLISNIFREMGLAEKLGSGFPTIFSSYRKAGLAPPEVIEGTNCVKVILPRTALKTLPSDGPVHDVYRLLLNLGGVSAEELRTRLPISPTTLRRYLHQLIEQGLVERKGRGKATIYLPISR